MCLPFCCGNDDHGSPSPGAGTGTKTAPDHPGHGGGQTEQAIPSSTRNGKGSQEDGNGASHKNKNGGDFNGGNTNSPPPPQPPPPPTPPQLPEDWAAEQTDTSTDPSGQAAEHMPPLPVQASNHRDPKKVVESPEHRDRIFTKFTPATKGPKQLEHAIAAGPRLQGPVAAPQPKDAATGTLRTPPSPQIARRGREDDYSPTVQAPAAASNGLGDRGHDDDHAYGGKDDRWPRGKTRR